MDASHILVGALTAISLAFLVWIEIRSRRNTAALAEQDSLASVPDTGARLEKQSKSQ
jgi:hypothetical protein